MIGQTKRRHKAAMKILLVHNFYREPGGEDVVFAQEQRLLERKGHQVITYTRSNHETDSFSLIEQLGLLKTIVSAQDSRIDIERLLHKEKPDVVHVHNTFMMISPSIYKACNQARVPIVQTLHNYRLLCPASYLFRDGAVCEECISGSLMRGVRYGCYRESRAATAAVASMLKMHRMLGTWSASIDAFISLTEFAKQKLVENGFPPERVHVKPNFVDEDPGERKGAGDYVLFVGRLSPEKGVGTLLKSWGLLGNPITLKIAGDGPARADLEAQAQQANLKGVEFLGRLDAERTRITMKGARFLVMPSLWYEGFPMVLAESFACGVPILGSRLGALHELIDDGENGLHFTAGSAEDLASKVEWAWEHPTEIARMGRSARDKFERKYGSDANYASLMEIYSNAIRENRESSGK